MILYCVRRPPQLRHADRGTISAALQHEHRQRDVKQAPAGEAVAVDSVAMVGELAESVEDDKVGGRRGHALINAGAAPVS